MIISSACFTDGGGRCLFDMGPCVYISMSATKRSVLRERGRGDRAREGRKDRERWKENEREKEREMDVPQRERCKKEVE